jgi:hypothetical protein
MRDVRTFIEVAPGGFFVFNQCRERPPVYVLPSCFQYKKFRSLSLDKCDQGLTISVSKHLPSSCTLAHRCRG